MRRQQEITTGHDSFLDVIANLVGIMVILVVIVGAHAKQSWLQPADHEAKIAQRESLATQIEKAKNLAISLEADNHDLERRIEKETKFADAIEKARHQRLVALEAMKSRIAKERERLEQEDAAFFDRKVQLANLEAELSEIQKARFAAEASVEALTKRKEQVIEHVPTPIAKTVFSEEIHFRLSQNRLSLVPMDQLIKLMKSEWKLKAEKLKTSPTTTETVGPIGNFRMQYQLESVREVKQTNSGPVKRDFVRLKQFVMIPVRPSDGETVDSAMLEGSEFSRVLANHDPLLTTVSIWVYPESFAEFNKLKHWLRERGFQVAGWPLSEETLISGSPNGFRSTAQ